MSDRTLADAAGTPATPSSARASRRLAAATLVVAVIVCATVTPTFLSMRTPDRVIAGPGVTSEATLSNWLPSLAGTPGDTPVYVCDGAAPGGTVLVLGGTHADEPAGYLAAVALAERVRVLRGRVLIVPRANASGFTHDYPQEGHPSAFTVMTASGPRRFTYGARATNPVHQWPDPPVYVLPESGQALSGTETRNLNRAYPGRADGTLTEQVAFAITSLIRAERVSLAIDLHEASPEYPVVNTMVAHERATDLAALANVNLQAEGIAIGLEASPPGLRGLSHREWGDSTAALAVLIETTNPAQGRLRGRTDETLVVSGRDRYYEAASARGRLAVGFPASGWPLATRVARHLAAVSALVASLGELSPEQAVELTGLPAYQEIVDRGLQVCLAR